MISVIIPAYNCEQSISRCLDSVLAQTYTDLEILVVDNNSTDHTAKIIQAYALKDARIHYLLCADRGASFARNMGIQNATGRYIFFLDADDWILPQALSALCTCADENEAQIVTCNLLMHTEKSDIIMEKTHLDTVAQGDEIPRLYYDLLPSYVFYYTFKLFHSVFLKQHNILFDPSVIIGEDAAFVLKVLKHVDTICYLSTPYHIYCPVSEGLNSKYHPSLFDMKNTLKNNIKSYLMDCSMPLQNLAFNTINDAFALIVNSIKAGDTDFKKIYIFSRDIFGSGIFGDLPMLKKLFYICLKYKMTPVLAIAAKLWLKNQ